MQEHLFDLIKVAYATSGDTYRSHWALQPIMVSGQFELQLLSYDETECGEWPHYKWLPLRSYNRHKKSPLSFDDVPLPIEVVKLAKETFAARVIKLTEVTK